MNDIFERISKVIITDRENNILKFGDLKIIGKLGGGQQGIVVLARNPNKKQFAIKFYSPSDKDPIITRMGRERFIREANILLKLKHSNIVDVYIAGSAKWNDEENEWVISADFFEPGEILYYVMDYIKGKNIKSLFYKSRKKKYEIDPRKSTHQNLNLFEQLILQISSTMVFFHEKGVTHRDIKPENIIYSENDNIFRIVDFGFAKYSTKRLSPRYDESILKKAYMDFDSDQKGIIDHISDQYMFAKMLLEILGLFKALYVKYNYSGIKFSLEKGAAYDRDHRYKNMDEFKKAIEPYLYSHPYHGYNFQIGSFLIPLTSFGYFNNKIRIPFSGSIPVFKEILDIIDTDDFQRLRGVYQIGPTLFVYPGATHTRFEHSLGTYFLSLKYLEVLLKNHEFYEAVRSVNESIKLVVLASLLHDIGHYPYSHWIEEINGLPEGMRFSRHEDRAKNIICKGKIGKIIKDNWEVDPVKVCKLITGGELSTREQLLRTIIDSVIDVDKIDYLQRDSAHCGVPYGCAFDVERLISSLYLNEERNKICLTEKGRSSFAALIMSNIVMYQEVYWHKTVRSCTAMFKRFFYEFLTKKIEDINRIKKEYLFYPDAKFIETLYLKTKNYHELNRLIRPFTNIGRNLYKPAYVHYHGHELYIGDESTKDFFELLTVKTYPDQIKMTSHLVDELRVHIPEIKLMDIILETTPVTYREVPDLKVFQYYDSKIGKYEPLTTEIMELNTYLRKNRRSYIFCAPEYYEKIKELSKEGKLRTIFSKVVERIRKEE